MTAKIKDYHKRRHQIIEYLGGRCRSCGTVDNLEIDHIDRKTKSFNISEKWSHSWESILPEIDKCQLLCGPCHKEKTKEVDGFKSEHGKFSMYRHGKCRCDLCKEANRLVTVEWRKKNKRRK